MKRFTQSLIAASISMGFSQAQGASVDHRYQVCTEGMRSLARRIRQSTDFFQGNLTSCYKDKYESSYNSPRKMSSFLLKSATLMDKRFQDSEPLFESQARRTTQALASAQGSSCEVLSRTSREFKAFHNVTGDLISAIMAHKFSPPHQAGIQFGARYETGGIYDRMTNLGHLQERFEKNYVLAELTEAQAGSCAGATSRVMQIREAFKQVLRTCSTVINEKLEVMADIYEMESQLKESCHREAQGVDERDSESDLSQARK